MDDLWYQNHAERLFVESDAYAKEAAHTADVGDRERLIELSQRLFKVATWLQQCQRLASELR